MPSHMAASDSTQDARRSTQAARSRKAHFRKFHRILVLVDRDILPLPIGQRRGTRREPQIHYTPDYYGMGMTFEHILDLTIDRRQGAYQQRHTRRTGDPFGPGKPLRSI